MGVAGRDAALPELGQHGGGVGTQLVHRLPMLISGDEFLNLVGAELACPAGSGSLSGRRNGGSGVGKFPMQPLQRIYLCFRVRVSSSNVHPRGSAATWPNLNVLKQDPGMVNSCRVT